jgi:integrase
MSTPHATAKRVTGHLKLVQRRAGPVWYAKTRVPGREPEQTTTRLAPAHLTGGPPPNGHLTRRQAQDRLDDILAEERRKVGQRAYEHGAATFADAAAGYLHYIEHVRGRERTTVSDYRGSIDGYLNPRWRSRPVDTITADDVEQLRDELLATDLSPRTVVRHLTVAHGVFRYAMRRHGLTTNPASADLVDRPPVRYSGEFQTLDPEQLAALVRAAGNPQDATLYLTAAQTGLRQGELRALRWQDIDFAADRIHVRRSATVGSNARIKPPKSGRVRSVPMVPAVSMALAQLWQRDQFTGDDDLVFGNVVGEIENDTLMRRRYQRALADAGLPKIRFHDLRHMFGTTAIKAFPLSDVQAMLGHAHITTTMRYVHHRPGRDDAARLAAAFDTESVSPFVSRTGDTEANSGTQRDTKTP